MAKVSEEQIARMKEELQSLKAKVRGLQEKKKKNPNLFSKLEDMQLKNYITLYNNLIAHARTLKIPLRKPGE